MHVLIFHSHYECNGVWPECVTQLITHSQRAKWKWDEIAIIRYNKEIQIVEYRERIKWLDKWASSTHKLRLSLCHILGNMYISYLDFVAKRQRVWVYGYLCSSARKRLSTSFTSSGGSNNPLYYHTTSEKVSGLRQRKRLTKRGNRTLATSILYIHMWEISKVMLEPTPKPKRISIGSGKW